MSAPGPGRVLVRGAHLADGHRAWGPADLVVAGGAIEGSEPQGPVDHTVDADGLLLTPAFLDLHVHLRDPGGEVKEDLASGLAAAAAGGFGTVVSMANTDPPVDEPDLVRALRARASRLPGARLRPAATLTRGLAGTEPTDAHGLRDAGAVMLTDDGVPVQDARLMRRACEDARELGLIVQTHSEEPSLRADGVMHEGEVSERLGLPGNPAAAEAAMIYRDCEIARLTGARVHIAHVTSRAGLEVVEFFKARGAPVTCEVTPHHLTLDHHAMEAFDPIVKVAPPLRTRGDVAALREGLARGTIDAVATDHAPHTRAEKERDLLAAPFGIANLEVCVALLYTELVEGGVLALAGLLRALQDGPAGVMGWDAPTLAPGAAADLTLLDLDTERPVTSAEFRSKARFSPWEGRPLRGWPVWTMVAGRTVFDRLGARGATG